MYVYIYIYIYIWAEDSELPQQHRLRLLEEILVGKVLFVFLSYLLVS